MKNMTLLTLQLFGFLLLTLGIFLNFYCMVNNDGNMPVKVPFSQAIPEDSNHYTYYTNSENINWEFASDKYTLVIPNYYIIFSLGDILILLGLPILLTFTGILMFRFKKEEKHESF